MTRLVKGTKLKSGSAKAPARHYGSQSGHGSDLPGLKNKASVTLLLLTRWGRWGKGVGVRGRSEPRPYHGISIQRLTPIQPPIIVFPESHAGRVFYSPEGYPAEATLHHVGMKGGVIRSPHQAV